MNFFKKIFGPKKGEVSSVEAEIKSQNVNDKTIYGFNYLNSKRIRNYMKKPNLLRVGPTGNTHISLVDGLSFTFSAYKLGEVFGKGKPADSVYLHFYYKGTHILHIILDIADSPYRDGIVAKRGRELESLSVKQKGLKEKDFQLWSCVEDYISNPIYTQSETDDVYIKCMRQLLHKFEIKEKIYLQEKEVARAEQKKQAKIRVERDKKHIEKFKTEVFDEFVNN